MIANLVSVDIGQKPLAKEKGKLKNTKGFARFEYQTDERGCKLQLVDDPLTATEIIPYIQSKLKMFIAHSNDAKRYYLPGRSDIATLTCLSMQS